MKVSILGAGSIGLAYTALLSHTGHEVGVLSPSGKSTQALSGGQPLQATGRVSGAFSPRVAESCRDAADGAEVVIIAVPSTGVRRLIDDLALCLRPGQVVVISSQSSLSALYLSKRLYEQGTSVPIVAWSTTAATARRTPPASVNIDTLRTCIDVATLHETEDGSGLAACRALFGDVFRPLPDLLAISLSNLNPPIHLANALANFTRIERGEYWANYDGITPAVGRMIDALDLERLAVAQTYGLKVRTVHDHYVMTFSDITPGPVTDMAAQVHRRRHGPPGPTSVETRYITEDVPFGLVPVVELGRFAGVELPLHEAGIRVISALMGRDLAQENDFLVELLAGVTAAGLRSMLRDGWRPVPDRATRV
jgi:opine dehydrogenase